jgi:SAM-dependent methyltransferase
MDARTDRQQVQEEEYFFPYHYLDLRVDANRLLWSIEYLSLVENALAALGTSAAGLHVLEVSCGDGRICHELHKRGAHATGVDYSDAALAFARAFNPEIPFVCSDAATMDLDEEFDAAIMVESLEHFIPDTIPAVLGRIAKHLAPGGRLVVTVPSSNVPLSAKHYQHFTAATLTKTLSSHFKVLQVSGYGRICGSARIFEAMRTLGYLLYPLRRRAPIGRYFDALRRFYDERLARCAAEDGRGLIAVCEPKTS